MSFERIERDTRSYIFKDKPWDLDSFFLPETRHVTALFDKSRTFIDSILGNQLYQRVCDVFLTDVYED